MSQNDLEELTGKIVEMSTEYCEYDELDENVNLKIAGFEDLILTFERYERYLDGIKVWKIEELNIDACYIKDLITEFINEICKNKIKMRHNNVWLLKCLKMMKKIDKNLKILIDKIYDDKSGQIK